MATLGDSLSAATFADRELAAEARRPEPLVAPKWIPFLGNQENRATYSWATGNKIVSHATRLRTYLEDRSRESMQVLNFATAGTRAAGLMAQIASLKSKQTATQARLEYVTLWIGANDACKTTDLASFSASLNSAFDDLAELTDGESIRVVVPGLPKIPELGREEVLNSTTATGLSCRTLRDSMLRFCNPLTVWSTPEEYAERVATTRSYHRTIEDAVERARRVHRNLDVRFVDEIFQVDFQPSDLAQDCFHPNARGQARLSEIIWNAQPWYH